MSFPTFFFQLIIQPISYIIEVTFLLFNEISGNTGISIIGVSLAVSVLCLPLYIVAEKWQEEERRTEALLAPGVKRIKSVFKGDEQYMILSTFYKQNHYHPMMALRSSFGLLIQIPFFIAAYNYLSNLELLHGQSFLFISDFGMPDRTFYIGSFAVNILPIAMTLINCVASAIYTKGHKLSEKIQVYSFALIFLLLLYDSPSGLVVYWTMNNVFSLVKNVFYKIKNPKKVIYVSGCIISACLLVMPFTLFAEKSDKIRILLGCTGLVIPLLPYAVKSLGFFFSSRFSVLDNKPAVTFTVFFLSAVGMCLLVGLLIPSMLISSEPDNFCFVDNYKSPFVFILYSFVQAAGTFVLWPVAIYFLFSRKTRKIMAFLFSFLFLFALINVFAFSGNYGPLEKNLLFMTTQSLYPGVKEFLLNVLCFCVVIAGVFFLADRKPVLLRTFTSLILFALVIVSFVNTLTIRKTYMSLTEPDSLTSIEPVYHLSKTEPNVIVLMQDRLFMPFVDEIIQSDSALKEQFRGFTFYPDTTSFGHLTMVGSPGIFGGYDYTPFEINKRTDETLQKKHNEALLTMPVLFNEAGFDVTVSNLPYENYLEAPTSQMYDDYPFVTEVDTQGVYSGFWYTEHNMAQRQYLAIEIQRNMFWVGLFKVCPPILRDVVYRNDYWNSNAFSSTRQELFINTYTPVYYAKQLTDFTSEKPAFLLVENDMTHNALCLDGPDYLLETSTDTEAFGNQTREAQYPTMINLFRNYGSFFDCLRENDVYDNTRIIIVSDHGMDCESELFDEHGIGEMKKEQFVSTLLVKDFNAAEPYTVDYSFMTNADTPAIALKGIVDDPVNPFTGNKLTVSDKSAYTKLTMGEAESTRNRANSQFDVKPDQWACVSENIFDDSNWKVLTPDEVEALR